VETFGVLITFKKADVAMVSKVPKLLNLFQTSRNFTVMFLVACRFANRNRGAKIIGWGDDRYCFAMAILVIIIILLLSFFAT
jgi:hypothetical protein